MQISTVVGWMLVTGALGQTITPKAIDEQKKVFQDWWGTDLVCKFDALPTEGSVPDFRVPYSGHIYPDSAGGTSRVLRKYDQAFHGGGNLATRFEQRDTSPVRTTEYVQQTYRYGLFGRRVGTRTVQMQVNRIPYWHGHCNGWTSAAIRYPEPQKTVVRNGVKFTPADIKALLAEVYMYQDEVTLAGDTSLVSRGHVSYHPGQLDRTFFPPRGHGSPSRSREVELSDLQVSQFRHATRQEPGRRESLGDVRPVFAGGIRLEARGSRERNISITRSSSMPSARSLGGSTTGTARALTCCGCPSRRFQAAKKATRAAIPTST